MVDVSKVAVDNEKDPKHWFHLHWDEFGKKPDVTIIRMDENNGGLFIEKVKEALNRGSPLTPEEESHIERTTFKHFYDMLDKGQRVVF